MRTGAGRLRCPACSGAVPAGAGWCTQCWADLRPAPDVPARDQPVRVLPVVVLPVPVVPVDAPPSVDGPAWPCAACGARTSFDRDACAGCGAGFLAPLHDDGPSLVLPVVGDVARLRAGQRTAVALALVLLVVLLTSLIGALLS